MHERVAVWHCPDVLDCGLSRVTNHKHVPTSPGKLPASWFPGRQLCDQTDHRQKPKRVKKPLVVSAVRLLADCDGGEGEKERRKMNGQGGNTSNHAWQRPSTAAGLPPHPSLNSTFLDPSSSPTSIYFNSRQCCWAPVQLHVVLLLHHHLAPQPTFSHPHQGSSHTSTPRLHIDPTSVRLKTNCSNSPPHSHPTQNPCILFALCKNQQIL